MSLAMRTMTAEQAKAFAAQWLPAWTGNDPERLLAFYADDAFYLDPAAPAGLSGKDALRVYFRKLLARNPDWVWTQIEGIPLEDGFLNKWHARMPLGGATVEVVGVCLVQLDAHGKIRRNEVYFDRGAMLQAIAAHK